MALLYHIVLPPPADLDDEEKKLFVHPDRFVAEMDDLRRRGWRTLTLTEFRAAAIKGDPVPGRFLLTFDDAYAHVADAVTPTLERLGFSAVMFAPWAHLGGRNTWDGEHPNLARLEIASQAELKAMDGHSWEVASHGMRHVRLGELEPMERLSDLAESRSRLGELLGHPVIDLAYPYGAVGEFVVDDVARAGYHTGFLALTDGANGLLQLPRIPVRGDEGMSIFRFRTGSTGGTAHRLASRAPRWAKTATRAVLR